MSDVSTNSGAPAPGAPAAGATTGPHATDRPGRHARPGGGPPPRRPARGERVLDWLDRALGSDPGLIRLRLAAQTVLAIGLAMLVEWVFVRSTHALQLATHGAVLPPPQAALVAAQHHGMLIIAMMLGAVMAMMIGFSSAMFPTHRSLLLGLLSVPILMVGGLCVGITLAPHRPLALASLAVILALGTYCRRFGAIGFLGGMVAFMGDFFGFFLDGEVHLRDVGWLAAEISLGVAVAALIQYTLFRVDHRRALRRMIRSYGSRTRRVSSTSLQLFDADAQDRPRLARRLHRQLVRLNETALMIDAQLGNPASIPAGRTANRLHQQLFDVELALSNMARFAEHLSEAALGEQVRGDVRTALSAVARLDLVATELAGHDLLRRLRRADGAAVVDCDSCTEADRIVLHRFASSALALADAVQDWRGDEAAADTGRADNTGAESGAADNGGAATAAAGGFVSSAVLVGGFLPGSSMVSAAASRTAGPGWWGRVRIAPHVRTAIQMGVAVSVAIILGDLVSGRRFYWAVIAAFVTFMGANNAGEQLRKGANRVVGTIVGVLLGAVGAHLVGQREHVAIAVILIALFFGLYLMRISYAFMVVGITVMVSQLYVQLDEFSDSMLLLRLGETAIGAGVAALTVLLVFPLHTGRVARVAIREYLGALGELLGVATAQLAGQFDAQPDEQRETGDLRRAARALDAAYQTVVATTAPLRVPLTGATDTGTRQFLAAADAVRNYSRNLVVDVPAHGALPEPEAVRVRLASQVLLASLAQLVATAEHDDGPQRTYVRSAVLFDQVAVALDVPGAGPAPVRLALRDVQLIDGALAGLAAAAGLTVQALDTTRPAAAQSV